jgi:hypothetical protein
MEIGFSAHNTAGQSFSSFGLPQCMADIAKHTQPVCLAEQTLSESSQVIETLERSAWNNVIDLDLFRRSPSFARLALVFPFQALVIALVFSSHGYHRVPHQWWPASRHLTQAGANEGKETGLRHLAACSRFHWPNHGRFSLLQEPPRPSSVVCPPA